MAKQNNQNNLLTALLYIVVGVLFCVFQDQIIGWILTVAGVAFIIDGILKVINKNTTNGLVEVLIGILIIVFGWTLLWVALLVFGVLIVINAVKDFSSSRKKTVDVLKLIVGLVVGVLLATNGFTTISWLFIVIGVVLIIEGILQLWPQLKK